MFVLDVMSRTPVYEQIIEQFEQYVLLGIFKTGDKLPSVRNLSMELSINPNTIQKAYSELDRRGLTCSVPGKGVFVSQIAESEITSAKRENIKAFKEMAQELKLVGVKKEELVECVNEVYEQKLTPVSFAAEGEKKL